MEWVKHDASAFSKQPAESGFCHIPLNTSEATLPKSPTWYVWKPLKEVLRMKQWMICDAVLELPPSTLSLSSKEGKKVQCLVLLLKQIKDECTSSNLRDLVRYFKDLHRYHLYSSEKVITLFMTVTSRSICSISS